MDSGDLWYESLIRNTTGQHKKFNTIGRCARQYGDHVLSLCVQLYLKLLLLRNQWQGE